MKQKKMLTLTFSQLKQIYGQEIPEIVEIADKSSTVEDFKAGILRLLETCRIENEAAPAGCNKSLSISVLNQIANVLGVEINEFFN